MEKGELNQEEIMMPIALTVSGNEKAIGLIEADMVNPDKSATHRYQIIYVVRDGRRAEFRRDLGLAKDFKGVRPVCVPSLLEHTVDEVINIAREIHEYDSKKIDVLDWLGIEKGIHA